MIMLRVWAGGIYEDDAFFDACDELGVLVWQDFLFACGLYPAHPDFLGSVQKEAEAAVKRLRHRPSLAIWCGNNEDYSIAESVGQYGNGKDIANFDARAIYEELLPRICTALNSQRPYWPGSPYSPGVTSILSASDQTVGDRHSWEIWHGIMKPYQDFHKVQGRFVSEFGMQSHPSMPLIESVVPQHERFPQSLTMAAHNKAGSAAFPDGHRRLAVYVADTLRCGDTLAEQVYATRFVQAEAMRYAYQDFRHRWQRPGARAVGGALVWQLNDCWPATSWAVIDSAGIVKPAWHAIRRALAPLAVALRVNGTQAGGWVSSDRSHDQTLHLKFAAYALSGETLYQGSMDLPTIANGSTAFEFLLPAFGQPVVVQVTAHANGKLLSSDTAWPEPFRFHHFASGGLSVTSDPASGTLALLSKHPVKGVWLAAPGLEFSDNFLDLMPGQVVEVKVCGDISATISIDALNLRGQQYTQDTEIEVFAGIGSSPPERQTAC
jgi:beta-mannosidase